MRTMRSAPSVALAVALCSTIPAGAAVEIDSNTFGGLRARAIGPAVMSGRIAALDAVAEDPLTIYAGAASGGVWKSDDGGVTWTPVFDDHPQSIGAIRIDPSDSETVWVGTGESWTRNSTSVGVGVYKSTDGGDNWELKGLEDSERIARIQVDPGDGEVVYVCATGHLWNANEERGVYKSTDDGESWSQVLSVDENTGCADLAMDPQDPSILYAGMWEFRRYPDFFNSGGPGSGLYRSKDGGESWEELANGLPEGDKGRIGVAVSPARPSRVWAVVEAEDTALYRSDDLGESWQKLDESPNMAGRPFYFAHIVADPVDFNRIYKPGQSLSVSDDGGKTFSSAFLGGFGGSVHPDHHALWINPHNNNEIVLGTDGGVYMSYDRGNAFRLIKALPVSQFYEVSYDMEWPYNVYGGLQDNGTWRGPSRAPGGVQNRHWETIGFGDGFHAYRDPHETDIVFVEFQGGQLLRHHLSTGEIKWIAPLPGEGEEDYRFNWNAPIHLSPSSPGTVYYGGQYLFRSRDLGESWEIISPDLTTDDPARQRQKQSGGLSIDNSTAENNTTIYTISESPLNGDLLWVGTDDGYVQVTRDGGDNWTNVTANIPGVPEGTWVSHVEASAHAEGTAHVTFDGHRSGDMATYLFRTTDYGESWESLVSEDIKGFAHVVVQDPVNPDLLYLGTEFGLFLTVDGGAQWARFAGDLPQVPVRDLDVHPREHDLIVGTHGRGIYILDDLTPLRALTGETVESKFSLLPSRDAVMVLSTMLQMFSGSDEFVGRNPGESASIVYYQNRRHIFGDLKVEVYDADGELVSTIPGGKRKGINRVEWPMRLKPPKMPPASSLTFAFFGPRVAGGEYTYKVIKGRDTYEGKVHLVPDPRSKHSAGDQALQQRTAMELYNMLESLTYVVEATVDLRDQVQARAEEMGERDRWGRRMGDYGDELESFRASLVSTGEGGMLSGDEKLREKMAAVYGGVVLYDGKPTQSQVDRTAVFAGQLQEAQARFAELTAEEKLAPFNSQLERRDMEPVALMTEADWEEEQKKGGGAASASLTPKQLERLLSTLTLWR